MILNETFEFVFIRGFSKINSAQVFEVGFNKLQDSAG